MFCIDMHRFWEKEGRFCKCEMLKEFHAIMQCTQVQGGKQYSNSYKTFKCTGKDSTFYPVVGKLV